MSNGLGEIIKAPSFAREYPINPDDVPLNNLVEKIDNDDVFENTVIFPDFEKKI